MAAATDTHVWMVPVTAEVAGLSTAEASALVLGSTFARRLKATDAHGERVCEHGRLHFQHCKFCAEGVPAMPAPTVEEQRENAKAWLV